MILSILATTFLTLVLYLSGFFVVFTPLPILLTIRKKGLVAGVISSLVALVLLALLYASESPWGFLPMMIFSPHLARKAIAGFSLLYLFYFVWIAWVIAYFSRKDKPFWNIESSVGVMTAAVLIGTALLALVLFQQTGFNLLTDLSGALDFLLQKMISLQEQAGMDKEELLYLQTYAPTIVQKVISLLPALWVTFTLMVLSLNILLFRRWMVTERPFPQWKEFSLWRLHELWIWAPILTGAAYFLNLYVLKSPVAATLLINVLLVLAAVYFLQGLAIISFLFRNKLPPWSRLLAYALVILFIQLVGILIMALGVFDFWFDFRKVKK